MRSLLGFLVFTAVLVGLGLGLLLPTIVAPMVASEVRSASPFGEQPLGVDVDVNAIGFVRGYVGEIHVSGTNLRRDTGTIGSLDLTVRDVAIGDHSFSGVTGTFESVTVPLPDQVTMLTIDRIEVSGPSGAVVATAHLDREAALAFIRWSFADVGMTVGDVDLIPGGISVVVFDLPVELTIGPQDGAMVIPDLLGTGLMELLTPQTSDPWRITGVTVNPGGMDIDASVDVDAVLAGS